MAAAAEVSLKLLVDVDVRGQRVLFAEAGKDFVDFLFNIMSLPVGTVVRLLNKEGMVGSLGNLYESIEKLSDVYMQPFRDKDALLKPKVLTSAATNLPQLLPYIEPSTGPKDQVFYRCTSNNCVSYIAVEPRATCPQCTRRMNYQLKIVDETAEKKASPNSRYVSTSSSEGDEGGFVKGVVTYMVMDDLVVNPMSTISSIALLNRFSVKDVGALEEKTVKMGMDKAVKLLKASLQSKTVLTDVFLEKRSLSI